MYRIVGICLLLLRINFAIAATDSLPLKKMNWPFEGIFGKFDRQAAQRGFQVYREVCAACHGLKHLYYRNLKQLGFSEDEVKEIAKSYIVVGEINDKGENISRPALPSDHFVSPFPNEQAAREANNGAYPADLSLIIKARPDGANYLYSLLTGYQDPPADFELMPELNYNPYFPGRQIAMPQPLSHGQVTYIDGTPASIEQMARDVTIFLQWAAEPEMEKRKSLGLKVIIYLAILTVLFYIAKKRIWLSVQS